MSSLPSRPVMDGRYLQEKPRTRGFLHVVRHGFGAATMYVVTYHRLDRFSSVPSPILAEDAETLIELLERLGVDFRLGEVRGALEDILRLGSANIPDVWFSEAGTFPQGLVDS